MEETRINNLAKNVSKADIEAMSTQDIKSLIGELQMYQTELQIKNKALAETACALQKTQDRYNQLFDFSPVGYVSLDKKTALISELNLAVTQLVAIDRKQLMGKRLAQFVVPEYKDEFQSFLKGIYEMGHMQMCELYLQPKTGKPVFVRLEGMEIESADKGRSCLIAIININERKLMEDELDRQVRQRTAELEHSNALLRAEIEERKKSLKDSEVFIAELRNAIQYAEERSLEPEVVRAPNIAPALTKDDVLKMKLKEFCDNLIDPVFGSRFWRYVVNSKKSYEPMFPMHELMEYTVQDFCDDMRCRLRIKKHYNNETLEKAMEAFAKYQLSPFGSNN